ncbi:MAG: prolyl oligopeptidase family serine peptidase [bacterium]
MSDQFGVRHHDVAFHVGDMSPTTKAVSCHRTPKLFIVKIAQFRFNLKELKVFFRVSVLQWLIVFLFIINPFFAAAEIEITVDGTKLDKGLKDGGIVSISLAEKAEGYSLYSIIYMSDGLRITGKLFVPEAAEGKRLPGVVFNHGGVSGIPQPMLLRCGELAAMEYVVMAPSYRGEDGSEGEVEVAAGEVNDALNAMNLLRRLPYIDPDRIGMVGTSHGALITLLATTRTTNIKAAIAAYGVTNAVSWYRYLVENGFDVSDPLSVKVYGKGPDDRPDAFRVRSPVLFAEKITTPLLLLYGENDKTIPPSQGKEMQEKLRKLKKDFEFKIIPAVGHGFLFFLDPEKHSKEEMKEADAAWQLVVQFLDKHLRHGDKK